MIERIKQFFRSLMDRTSGRNKKRYIIIVGLLGLFIIILSNMFSPEENKKVNQEPLTVKSDNSVEIEKEASPTSVVDIEKHYEAHLTKMLNGIEGISDVDIMVNLTSTDKKIYEKDRSIGRQATEETDTSGGTRLVEDETEESSLVLIREGDREVPLLIQTNKPDVKGVFIIATGIERAEVKKVIIEAVSKALDVPTHRISVVSRAKGEN